MSEGDYIDSWALTAANASPFGMTTDGTNIWVVDTVTDDVYKYDMEGNYIDSWSLTALNTRPFGIGTDGSYIWVVDNDDSRVYKYSMTGTYLGGFYIHASGNTDAQGLGTDGTNIWIADRRDNKVYKYTMAGTYISSFSTHSSGNTYPRGLGTDGNNIWVADYDDKAVYKYEGPSPPPEICSWINSKGGPFAISITNVFELVDSHLSNVPPVGYSFVPTLQNIFGVIDYYFGFDGDAATGCDFFP